MANGSWFQICQATNEPPSSTEFTDGEHQFVISLPQWNVDGVVFRIHNAQKPWVAKILGASAAEQNPAIQEHGGIIAVTDRKLFHLVAVRNDGGPRIEDFHPGLRLQAFGEIVGKGHFRVRSFAITVQNHKAGRLGLHVLPGYCTAFRWGERALEVALKSIV